MPDDLGVVELLFDTRLDDPTTAEENLWRVRGDTLLSTLELVDATAGEPARAEIAARILGTKADLRATLLKALDSLAEDMGTVPPWPPTPPEPEPIVTPDTTARRGRRLEDGSIEWLSDERVSLSVGVTGYNTLLAARLLADKVTSIVSPLTYIQAHRDEAGCRCPYGLNSTPSFSSTSCTVRSGS